MEKMIEVKNRFGKLLAIEKVKESKSGNITYKCLCDCGNIIEASGRELRKGLVTHCGCSEIKRKKKKKMSNSRPKVMPGFEKFLLYGWKARKLTQPIDSKK